MTAATLAPPREILPWDAPREAWLAARIPSVTATDITALCGLHPYLSAWEVYQAKIGQPVPDTAGEAAEIGVALEPVLADMWEKRDEGRPTALVGLCAHAEHDWMRCSPDRVSVLPGWDEGRWDLVDGVVELKTALGWAALDYDDDTVPDRHVFQVQWQLAVTSLPRAWLVALAGPSLKTYVIERDQQLIDDLTEIGHRFLVENVERRRAPAPDGSDRLAKILGKRWEVEPGKTVVLNPAEYWPLRLAAQSAGVEVKAAKVRETEAKNAIRLLIGDAETAVIDGEPVATWKTGQRVGYTVAPTTTRTLRFTKAGSR